MSATPLSICQSPRSATTHWLNIRQTLSGARATPRPRFATAVVGRATAMVLLVIVVLGGCRATEVQEPTDQKLEDLFALFPAQAPKHEGGTALILPEAHSPAARRLPARAYQALEPGQLTRMNFAAHYEIITWGCGTSCSTGIIVDVRTGKIVGNVPTCEWGRAFRPHSVLFVANPPAAPDSPEAKQQRPDWASPRVYVWTGQRFKAIVSTQN